MNRQGFTPRITSSPLQHHAKFIEHGALQCGFCTPAAVVAATALLKQNPSPTREDIIECIEGVLCRCTGYRQIVDAIMDASQMIDQTRNPKKSISVVNGN